MKVKFIAPEYANFNGHFGTTEFIDGVSVDIPAVTVRLLASLMTLDVVEGEADASYESLRDTAAPTEQRCLTLAEINAASAHLVATLMAPPEGAVVEAAAPVVTSQYNVTDLEAIADTRGIAGLREIAEPLGVHAQSIHKIIKGILAAQSRPAAADFLAEVNSTIVSAPTKDAE